MKTHLLTRLGIVLAAAVLMLLALPYYWQDNVFHEVAGTGMLVLLVAHNVFNRRWYTRLLRSPIDARGVVDITVVLWLATVMLTLLVTSVMVSNTLFSALALDSSFRAKQLHALAAYWGLIILGAHVGMRWTLLMGIARGVVGVKHASSARTWVLRIAALAIVIQGIRSSFALNIGSKVSSATPGLVGFWGIVRRLFSALLRSRGALRGCQLLRCVVDAAHQACARHQKHRHINTYHQPSFTERTHADEETVFIGNDTVCRRCHCQRSRPARSDEPTGWGSSPGPANHTCR